MTSVYIMWFWSYATIIIPDSVIILRDQQCSFCVTRIEACRIDKITSVYRRLWVTVTRVLITRQLFITFFCSFIQGGRSLISYSGDWPRRWSLMLLTDSVFRDTNGWDGWAPVNDSVLSLADIPNAKLVILIVVKVWLEKCDLSVLGFPAWAYRHWLMCS